MIPDSEGDRHTNQDRSEQLSGQKWSTQLCCEQILICFVSKFSFAFATEESMQKVM